MPKPKKPAQLKPFKTLRIFCEGAKTEPSYIKAYLATLHKSSRQSVIEVEKTSKNTAVQLVDEAIKVKRSNNFLSNDEVWVVYDRESTAKYSESLHKTAYDRARRAGIHVALTNVCFEYWLLLHFVNTSAPYSSFDDLIHSSSFRSAYKAASGKDYDKAATTVFETISHRLPEARIRAGDLNKAVLAAADPARNSPYQVNSFVGFACLLDAIDAFAES